MTTADEPGPVRLALPFEAFAARPGGAAPGPGADTALEVATAGPEVEVESPGPDTLVFAATAAPLAGVELPPDELSDVIALEDAAPAGAALSDDANALVDAAALVLRIAGVVEAATSPKLPGRVALPPISSTPRASSVARPLASSSSEA